MKIAFVTASVSRKAGGLQESVRRLAQSLSNGASYVQAFTLLDEHTAADRSCWDPVPVTAFPIYGPARFGFAPGLCRALPASQASLIMSHGLWMYPSIATHRWHKKTGRPYILHSHGMLDPWAVKHSRWKKRLAAFWYERQHLEDAACIRALCEAEAEAIRAYGPKNPIAVIPNGIDLPDGEGTLRTTDRGPVDEPPACGGRDAFHCVPIEQEIRDPGELVPAVLSDPMRETSEPENSLIRLKDRGRKVLLYLGRIHPKKGLVNLVKAWAALGNVQRSTLDSEPDQWLLAIAGWDQNGHEAELKRLATELGIAWHDVRERGRERKPVSDICGPTSVLFLGPRFGPDKAACYRDCDAFILPSYGEGLPMVVLEAWAYGRPVIMTPHCNLPEGFTSGAGFRTEASVPALVHTMREVLGLSRRELLRAGSKGKQLVSARFSWPEIADEMKRVCDWVLGGGPPPSCVVRLK